ncbi:MAG: response regulator, partial [Ruminococcus sp.]|nr:response regulator [Ruminococcus sp.]
CAAILTGISAAYRSSTNIFTTMANDKILSKKFRSTSFCVVFMMVISISVSFMGRNALIWFVELTTLGAIVGFAYTSASAFVIAKRNKNKRNMTVGIIGAVFTAAFAVVQLVPGLTSLDTIGPQSFFMLALWCLLGFAFYWRSMRQSSLSEYNGNFFASTALFAMLLYSALMWYLDKIFSVLGTVGEAEDIKLFTVVFFSVIAVGMGVMIYIQKLLRQRHSEIVREKIRAEENNKAKSRFLFNMSHDIRTPMNAIIGFTNLALKENNSPKLDNYLNKIKTSSRHLLELINDILEMSRIENGSAELNLRREDICEIISQTYDLFTSQMQEKGIEFTIDISAVKHNYVMCDSKNLNRILMNIVSNAYKFTPENGKISVTASEMTTDDENLSIYQLKVSDTGIGMSPEFAKKIFNAFERERTSTVSGIQGTGLGMAITKSIVDLMEGTIEVITEKGKGTTFVIDIPLQITEAPEKPEEEETTGIAVDPSGIRMLLVEDNLINMEIASLILRENGFEFDTAENGKEAYEKVAASEPGYYSVVLMDIQMPVMDGYEAARNIRALKNKELASVPIIALTANAFKEDERAAGEAGMQGHIAKPIDVGEMMKTLSVVLKK